MIFGAFGLGYLAYGKSQRRISLMLIGLALCVFPSSSNVPDWRGPHAAAAISQVELSAATCAVTALASPARL
jgi:hypothetical protein